MSEQATGVRPPIEQAVAPYLNKWGPYRLTRDEVNTTAIRYFCEVAEDANPVYWDDEFARKTRFGRLIAPPQALFSMTFAPWWQPDYVAQANEEDAHRLSAGSAEVEGFEVHRITDEYGYTVNTVTNTESEYLDAFGPGDGRIKTRSMTTSVSPEKQTRVGKGVFITSVTEYRTEVGDRLIGRSTMVLLKYNPAEPRKD
ncbi:MAG TPA: MaoC family dehydratase N-terminal domain-containing protein [Dehalococcoidia bacterium]|nr:MaoC family dehydratase N-terminal domain-containing protein [Dehalococcoidia bacterium]